MNGRIQILDESVANIIAAGEVVENPASMIKELVENSLDAKATMIKILVKNSGRYVKIIDNGMGMTKDDLFLCIERHATSKISKKEDIFNLSSYGFRGEALASISSVAKVKLISRTKEDKTANLVYVSGGKITKVEEVAKNIGTEIEVKNLFFNTPARLKFLRKMTTEYNYIKDIVLKEALVNYNVSFSLFIDERQVLNTSGKGIENTILEIFGKSILKKLSKFEYGYLGNTELLRSSKDYMFTYFNKRYAKSRLAEKAIIDGYYTKLMKNKYPFAIIFLELPPSEMDVNVHPSKKIIKFADGSKIYSKIKLSVESSIESDERNKMPVMEFRENFIEQEKEDFIKEEQKSIKFAYEPNGLEELREVRIESKEIYKNKEEIVLEQLEKKDDIEKVVDLGNKNFIDGNNKIESKKEEFQINESPTIYNEIKEVKENKIHNKIFKIIGQLKNMYILVESNDSLELYDQHIVHERILYEELKEKLYNEKIISQSLLIPLNIKLDYLEKNIVVENIEVFDKFGFSIEDFGDNELLIRKVPLFDFRDSMKNVFIYIIQELKKEGTIKDIREKIIISMSCKGAVKAGEKLNIEEMKILINQLHNIGKYTCPHGRPIIINLPFEELDKKFRRRI